MLDKNARNYIQIILRMVNWNYNYLLTIIIISYLKITCLQII